MPLRLYCEYIVVRNMFGNLFRDLPINKQITAVTQVHKSLIEEMVVSDATMYAHFVFKAFDVNCNGAISFRVSDN